MIRSVKREVQDLDPAVMAESAAVDSEAEASAVAVDTASSSIKPTLQIIKVKHATFYLYILQNHAILGHGGIRYLY